MDIISIQESGIVQVLDWQGNVQHEYETEQGEALRILTDAEWLEREKEKP